MSTILIDPPVDWHIEPPGKRFDTVIATKLGFTDLQVSNGLLWGTKKGQVISLPEYSTDTDAALYHLFEKNLPDNCDPRLMRVRVAADAPLEPGWTAVIVVFQHGELFGHSFRRDAQTPALAICQVWLSYVEAHDGNQD